MGYAHAANRRLASPQSRLAAPPATIVRPQAGEEGRYDKLIEMFGGPPTPAVGFGMGDVVLSLVLADKGLLPKDEEVAARLGLNPDALVISNGTPEADGAVAGVVASLRRAGLHARRSYKTTKNIGKLIQDAAKMRARYCVILENATAATVKDMKTQAQEACSVEGLVERVRACR